MNYVVVLLFSVFISINVSAQRTYKKLNIGLEGGSTHHWSDLSVVDIRKFFGKFFWACYKWQI